MKHFSARYLLDPVHPVTVSVIGAGGTGSQLMQKLGRIHHALLSLGHMGLYVTLFDPDMVSESNIGRQLFAQSDIGANKASMVISRINRFYGTNWKAISDVFRKGINDSYLIARSNPNIVISCVDSIASRKDIYAVLKPNFLGTDKNSEFGMYYWMDIGNDQHYGQIVLGSCKVQQPEGATSSLMNFFELYPKVKDGKAKGPSCSLAEALHSQDLFINSMLAELAGNMIWKLFREGGIDYNVLLLNLNLMSIYTQLKLKQS